VARTGAFGNKTLVAHTEHNTISEKLRNNINNKKNKKTGTPENAALG
jgi:hypothetical protein